MKHKSRISLSVFILLISLCLSLVSCGEGEKVDTSLGDGKTSSEIVNSELNRKIIYTVNIDLETESISDAKVAISEKCAALGGYVESNNESYSDGECTSVSTTYRIPTDKLDEFVSSVESQGSIDRKRVSTTDITTSYVNAEAQKSALEERKAALEEILADEGISASDRISVINEISSVNTALQEIEITLKSYDSKVDFSYVTVNIDEPSSFIGVIIVLGVLIAIPCAIILIYDLSRKKKAAKSEK